jgi:PAS domain S-box-containing protein
MYRHNVLHKRRYQVRKKNLTSVRRPAEAQAFDVEIIREITHQANTLERIGESERQLRALIGSAPLGLHQYQLFPDGRLIFTGANPAADMILGIKHRDLIGLAIQDAFPTHRQTDIPAIYCRVAEEGTPYSCEQVAYEDQQIQGVFEIHAFQTGRDRMAVFFQDITEKKRAAESLRESEEKYRTLIEKSSEGIVLYDEQGLTVEWNAAQEQLSGISRQEALGRPAWDLQFQLLPLEKKTSVRYEEVKERGIRILQSDQSPIFYQPLEASIHRLDGTQAFIQQTVFPIKTGAGFRIGSITRDITDSKRAAADLQRRMVELEALHAVAVAGTEAVSADDLLSRVGEILCDKLFPDHFGVALMDGDGLVLNNHSARTREPCMVYGRIPLDQGIIGSVARTGVARRVDDVRFDPDYFNGNPDTCSELCVPIMVGSQVIGVINLENEKIGSFTRADEHLVTAVAGELGTAIEKIRLLEEERSRRKELEALEDISAVLRTEEDKDKVLQAVLARIMSALNLAAAGFACRDALHWDFVSGLSQGEWMFTKGMHLPAGEGIGHQVASSQHYYLNNDARSELAVQFPGPGPNINSLLCLALLVNGQTHGLLYLGRASAFLRQDIHLAITVADTLASALQRLELHEQTQNQLARLTALRTIDQSILSRLDLERTLDVLLENITRLLRVDAANFLLFQSANQKLVAAAERGLNSIPLWDANVNFMDTHAGKVALSREMEFISDLSEIDVAQTDISSTVREDFTSYVALPLVAKGELKGVLQIFSRSRLELSPDWKGLLEALADQAAIAINSAQLFIEQQQTTARLTRAYEETIDGWSHALDLRDKETDGHSQRVTDLTLELARRMGLKDEALVHIRRGARLHDIGKMGIPDRILLKAGPLTEDEWDIMRRHPIFATDLLFPIEFLGPALEIPFGHHEKWDGTGYPLKLKGEEIPLSARIFAVVDVWDALISDRPYRPAWSERKAIEYIREQAGKHFDPLVVEHFLTLVCVHYLLQDINGS